MRTITLELLRHGPAHNQLLSPLTPYLALCENHGAVTLHVPFEHNQFLHRLDALGYKLGEQSRKFQLKDTAAVMGEILGTVPGLTAEANKQGAEPLTHLRLILSSSELALLPFELALAPAGFPGAGQHLLLQPQMPICLTREIRRAPDDDASWSDRPPRILFAAASPPGQIGIPLEAHLLALRRAIQPWVSYFDPKDADARARNIAKHLVFLPEASVESIEDACATGGFTHVHILAHGQRVKEGHDTRFALALHKAGQPERPDPVSGTRLATALRASRRSGSAKLARPTVVTLASCNSGDVGSVAGAGASIAHALHDSGIPVVVAGQFPLSFGGSVRLLEVLYNGFLSGADPRLLLHDLRRRLYSQFPQNHDWASLTAYVSLPRDFAVRLPTVQIDQARRSIDAAISHADEATAQWSGKIRDGKGPEHPKLTATADTKLTNAKQRLEELLERFPDQQAVVHGRLASTEKRHAEILFQAGESSDQLLAKAREHYWHSFMLDRTNHWGVVQYLSLALITGVGADASRSERDPKALWNMARMLSHYDLHAESPQARCWAHGNLIELYVLSVARDLKLHATKEAEQLALDHVDDLVDIAGRRSFEVYSTRRQMRRYFEWFNSFAVPALGPAVGLARTMFKKLPQESEEWSF